MDLSKWIINNRQKMQLQTAINSVAWGGLQAGNCLGSHKNMRALCG